MRFSFIALGISCSYVAAIWPLASYRGMCKQMCSSSIGRNVICILVAATFPSTKEITSVTGIMSRHCPPVVHDALFAQVASLSGPPVFVKVRRDFPLGSTFESQIAVLEWTARIIIIWAQVFVNVSHDLLLS
jgi:hypothetical protein